MNAIDSDIPKHRKQTRKARPFIVEVQWPALSGRRQRDWNVWGRYESEKQREQAIEQLKKGRDFLQFRKREDAA